MKNYLPNFPDISQTLRNGRNIYEGYQRGWGLEFGNLQNEISSDPLYKEAANLARGRSIVAEEKRMNIFLILRFFLAKVPFGHIIEFGSYRSGNTIFMAAVVRELYPSMKVYALDTFTGMPQVDKTIDAHNSGDFKDVDLNELIQYTRSVGLSNLEFRKGLFQDTGPKVLREAKQISLAHIDCDIYSAVAYTYDIVKKNMVQGGYLVFDDATYSSCLGATEAVESLVIRRDKLNSEQIYPHFVFRADV